MKSIRVIAKYYVDFMVKLGLIRFSLLLAVVLIVLTTALMMVVTLLLQGRIESLDLLRSFLFSLLITPCAVYFLSIIVSQLELSRQELGAIVQKLERLHQRDLYMHTQLQQNIEQLSQEIDERIEAEQARQLAFESLRSEVANRKQTQVELEQQTALLRSFLDASPDLVFYRDEEFRISGCNRAMELLTGKGEKQLIGLTSDLIYEPSVAQKDRETDEKVFQHHVSITYEIWITYPDSRKACFEVRKVPFYDKAGNRQGLMGFGRDITEHKRYQEALEKASRDKTTFISTISHELRTPLNGIIGLSRILLDMKLTTEQEKYLKTIHVSAITLGNIFNDIIELDKIERRKSQLNPQPVEVTDFLSDLTNISTLLAEPKGLYFKFEQQTRLPSIVLADGTRLRQILWNLIGNAVKFTQRGGVTVRVGYLDNSQLYFEVEDTGIGIPKSEQDKIFAMYYQVKQDDFFIPGTGIGLAVSQRLAQAMGGGISLKSEPKLGSCFTVVIDAPELTEPQQNSDQDDPAAILHILLVEDIELNVVVARSILEKQGHTLDVAMTGKQALEMFTPEDYDLVLLDIQLPDMTGFDITRQIRQHYAGEVLPPLIALTANVLKDKQEYLAAGIDDVLSKPLSVSALSNVIKRFWGTDEHENDHPAICYDQPDTHLISNGHENILDISMLQQYIDMVGSQLIEQSLNMFEKMMPAYITALDANMIARDQHGITEEAHKIKGAAGSIGLLHIQQLAQQIQSPELPAWWDNVEDWIDELKLEWHKDLQTLKQWVEKQSTNGVSK